MQVARLSVHAMEIAQKMADVGNPNSITDAGVGAMAIRTGVKGAVLNARVNLADLADEAYVDAIRTECQALWSSIETAEANVLSRVDAVLSAE